MDHKINVAQGAAANARARPTAQGAVQPTPAGGPAALAPAAQGCRRGGTGRRRQQGQGALLTLPRCQHGQERAAKAAHPGRAHGRRRRPSFGCTTARASAPTEERTGACSGAIESSPAAVAHWPAACDEAAPPAGGSGGRGVTRDRPASISAGLVLGGTRVCALIRCLNGVLLLLPTSGLVAFFNKGGRCEHERRKRQAQELLCHSPPSQSSVTILSALTTAERGSSSYSPRAAVPGALGSKPLPHKLQ